MVMIHGHDHLVKLTIDGKDEACHHDDHGELYIRRLDIPPTAMTLPLFRWIRGTALSLCAPMEVNVLPLEQRVIT